MRRLAIAALAAALLGFATSLAQAAPEAPEVYAPCAACHSGKPDALGPDLAGVLGRTAGSAPGFRYSGPLKRSGIVWTRQTLREWLIDPQALVPGNRMPWSGTSPEEADRIAAYLAGRETRAKP